MSETTRDKQEAKAQEALRDIDRVGEQSEVLGTSALRRSAERARDHMLATDADNEDSVELWGRRIGRGLSLAAFIVLAVYLYLTYIA